jgi:hypothetical protein
VACNCELTHGGAGSGVGVIVGVRVSVGVGVKKGVRVNVGVAVGTTNCVGLGEGVGVLAKTGVLLGVDVPEDTGDEVEEKDGFRVVVSWRTGVEVNVRVAPLTVAVAPLLDGLGVGDDVSNPG